MRQPKLGGGFIYSKLFKYASNVHENYERFANFTIFFGYQMGWQKTTWLLFLFLFGVREIFPFPVIPAKLTYPKSLLKTRSLEAGRPCSELGPTSRTEPPTFIVKRCVN